MNTNKSDEAQSASFETIAPEKDNPVRKEFEIEQLKNEESREDEFTRHESRQSAPGNIKPSQLKF